MAWIEAHQSLLTHRKTNRAIALLKCDRNKFIGHLFQLWWWCLDNAPDGNFGDLLPEEIAGAAGWPVKTGDAFVRALVASGFFDEDGDDGLRLHGWEEYTSRLMARREAGRKGGLASGEARRESKQNEATVQPNEPVALTPTNQPHLTSPTQPTNTTEPTRLDPTVRLMLDVTPDEVRKLRSMFPNADISARHRAWISWIEEEMRRGRNRVPDDKMAALVGWLKKDDGHEGSAPEIVGITRVFTR